MHRFQDTQFKVEVSYYEIYSEQIFDLLTPPSKQQAKQHLKVREHPVMGPYVDGLAAFAAVNVADIEGYLTLGGRHRATAATNMNATSSRSHAIFTMVITQVRGRSFFAFFPPAWSYFWSQTTVLDGEEHSKVSKVNLVDLAGSERSDAAGTSGQRLRVRKFGIIVFSWFILFSSSLFLAE
jgi:hypothetical protein